MCVCVFMCVCVCVCVFVVCACVCVCMSVHGCLCQHIPSAAAGRINKASQASSCRGGGLRVSVCMFVSVCLCHSSSSSDNSNNFPGQQLQGGGGDPAPCTLHPAPCTSPASSCRGAIGTWTRCPAADSEEVRLIKEEYNVLKSDKPN